MKITKYEHSCVVMEEGRSKLIIDPGIYSNSLVDITDVTALVITHVHADHFDESKVEKIIKMNLNVQIFSTEEVAKEISAKNVVEVEPSKIYRVGDFNLEFVGQMHEVVDPKTPIAQNSGVLVNGLFYSPGDSYEVPTKPFKILSVPKSGPWLRVKDALPMFEKSDCTLVIGTHDALINDQGHASVDNWYVQFAERNGKKYKSLKTGESIEI